MQSRNFELLLCILRMLFESEILLTTVSPLRSLSPVSLSAISLSPVLPSLDLTDWRRNGRSLAQYALDNDTAISRKAFSEKVHAKIPKSIVGNFGVWLFFKEIWQATDVCLRVLKSESNQSKFDSYGVRNGVFDHIPCYLLGIVACTCFQTTLLEIASFFFFFFFF